ncbi:MAG: DUF3108 domain-containing protein [Candidatus Poribacteria bacterium]|nr:DUF3108 domain-containing protein [Candidatus Poribacteria bacterium]
MLRAAAPLMRAILAGAALLAACAAWADMPLHKAPALEPLPIKVGERLEYKVKLGIIGAGTQTMEIAAKETMNGAPVFKLLSKSQPSSALKRIYSFYDEKTSYIHLNTLLPIRYEKDIQDRSYKAKFLVRFDRSADEAKVWKDGAFESTVSLKPFTQDELSMIYYMRSRDLRPGETYTYDFFTGRKVHSVKIHVKSRVFVDAPKPIGKRPALRIEASDGFRMWLTADADRLPVKIEAPVKFFGTLKAELSKYRAGR